MPRVLAGHPLVHLRERRLQLPGRIDEPSASVLPERDLGARFRPLRTDGWRREERCGCSGWRRRRCRL